MKICSKIILLSLIFLFCGATIIQMKWGFFGHRRINRMAVFTLPSDMIGFYKKHIEFITEHAVDPDKRRYATKHEAVRHFIDIDHWGTYPFDNVPREWTSCLMKFTDLYIIKNNGDTITLNSEELLSGRHNKASKVDKITYVNLPNAAYRKFFEEKIMPQYYEEEWLIQPAEWAAFSGISIEDLDCRKIFAKDHFSEFGILPYHLLTMKRRLTEAFKQKSTSAILRVSAEIGHYIGDAYVPLHTTENYNGEMTDQVGIHAFWESRIPELFADEQYDFFVGPANYIANPSEYFWDIVLDSHLLLDSVLTIEKTLSQTFPKDRQYCYDERLGLTIRTECREYAQAYQERMNGMVEQRMRDAVLAIGSIWYTSWVDAGQPDLKRLDQFAWSTEENQEASELEKSFQKGEIKGREH